MNIQKSSQSIKQRKRNNRTDKLDAPRRALCNALQIAGLSLKDASRAVGRNDAYLQQYLYRGSPRHLPEVVRHQLAALAGVSHARLAEPSLTPPNASYGGFDPEPHRVGQLNSNNQPANIAIPLLDERSSADSRMIGNDNKAANAQIGFPDSMLRRITTAPAVGLQLISITGDSMAPTLEDGDLVMIDSNRTQPSPPGIFVLDDGVGLVAKRVDAVPNTSPQMLRLSTDNPAYTNYQRRFDEVHIVGRVVWFARPL
ncbi:peptidase S24 [Alphaproteobacteria bacterium]|jgi:phage repressor protein C with HTH and peptisase S24 domain|nr:peptidase S24 [Alphaproteobacteria bacterium]